MQFKHPEILYFLALLIIPILVHLFQLQKFVKVPFTNVAFLQKLVLQTRKSSRIKKWLILATRLLLLCCIILAFSQPYFSNKKADKQEHFFLYLDNSLSTNTEGNKGDLLKVAIQELIENLSEKATYSLQTNNNFHQNKTASELKDILLKIENTSEEKTLKDVFLKISTEKTTHNSINKSIIISDFQNSSEDVFKNFNESTSYVQLTPQLKENLSIDSISVNDTNSSNFEINILIRNQGIAKNNIPIAIYKNKKLINKQTFNIKEDSIQKVVFSIQKTPEFLGKVLLNFKDAFSFDNSYYFSLVTNEKINVLSIGEQTSFLNKIYTKDEFNFLQSSIKNINYNAIPKQQLIILNEIENLPETLITSLLDYLNKGGDLTIIPSKNISITSYNKLFKKLGIGRILEKNTDSLKITSVNFKHPIFKNVFEKKVSNFQYPNTVSSYSSLLKNSSNILFFENNTPFVSQVNLPKASVFWIAAPLLRSNSNFTNSPLIVPLFYNMGKQSLQLSKLYYIVNKKNNIDINKQLGKEVVLAINNENNSFIPLQQVYQNKIRITTNNQPLKAGFNYISQQKDTLKSIAFNYNKKESLLNYLTLKSIVDLQNNNSIISTSVKDTLRSIHKKNEVQWLWKWFLILSIVSLLLEILILKFFKP
ncbi:N-terminal double-transmembrane domain-containing protein [Tenacibaculum sp. MAR_2010_89]|uniref:BatA domain-containing protein n=1 Tax=Tenacibaculum sp. MAR_2010_89 TaxID=1250198 RepID=UPI00089D9B95|nr:BatA domain-containing protein [Tenacibaculum sp. MAR_2010_89]SEE65780.1 N-terminal double-transmembrane domain-containing protein [Tenacibaculum sp. MAR_2010_89]